MPIGIAMPGTPPPLIMLHVDAFDLPVRSSISDLSFLQHWSAIMLCMPFKVRGNWGVDEIAAGCGVGNRIVIYFESIMQTIQAIMHFGVQFRNTSNSSTRSLFMSPQEQSQRCVCGVYVYVSSSRSYSAQPLHKHVLSTEKELHY